jgi:hypothetical protein
LIGRLPHSRGLSQFNFTGVDWSTGHTITVQTTPPTYGGFVDGTIRGVAVDEDADYITGYCGVTLGGMGGTNKWALIDNFAIANER